MIACIGAGEWGKNVVSNFYDLGALSYVCDPAPKARQRIAANYPGVRVNESLEGALKDPNVEGVAIATPASTHCEIVRSALTAGEHPDGEPPCAAPVG